MDTKNSKFLDKYKDVVMQRKKKELDEDTSQKIQEADIKARAAAEKREQKEGMIDTRSGKMPIWDYVKQEAANMRDADAASYNDWRQCMTSLWSFYCKLSKAINYSTGELVRGIAGMGVKFVYYPLRAKASLFFMKRNSDLPDLEYDLNLKEGERLKATLDAGEPLTDDNLDTLFAAEIEQWLEEVHGYKLAENKKDYINEHLAASDENSILTPQHFDELRQNQSFELWLQNKCSGLKLHAKSAQADAAEPPVDAVAEEVDQDAAVPRAPRA